MADNDRGGPVGVGSSRRTTLSSRNTTTLAINQTTIGSLGSAALAEFIEKVTPALHAALGAPGELPRDVEDLRTRVAEARIELRRRAVSVAAVELRRLGAAA
jgi:hypothetical protein